MKTYLRGVAAVAVAAVLVTLGFASPAPATAYGTIGDLGVHDGKHFWSRAWISGWDRVISMRRNSLSSARSRLPHWSSEPPRPRPRTAIRAQLVLLRVQNL